MPPVDAGVTADDVVPERDLALDVVVVAYGAPGSSRPASGGSGARCRSLVVDNSSRADVRKVCDRHGARYVDPGRNLGFAGGVNLGLATTRVDRAPSTQGGAVLLLNPDATIGPDGVARLQRFLVAHRWSGLRGTRPGRRRRRRGRGPGGVAVPHARWRPGWRRSGWVDCGGGSTSSSARSSWCGRQHWTGSGLSTSVLPLRRGDRLATPGP